MKKKNLIIIVSVVVLASASGLALWAVKSKSTARSTTTCNSSKLNKRSASSPSKTTSSNNEGPKNNISNNVISTIGTTNGNLINRGTATEEENWIYFSSKTPYSGIYKTMPDMKTAFQKLSGDDAYNLTVIGDWLYYIQKDSNKLYKIKTNGTGKTQVIKDACQYFIIKDNYLYYWTGYCSNPNIVCTLFKTKLGEDKKVALGIMPISKNPFTIDDKGIYYVTSSVVDKNIDSFLVRMDYDGYHKTQLNNTTSMNPLSSEDWVYYTDNLLELRYNKMTPDTHNNLWRINKTTSTKEKLCEACLCYNIKDEYIYYIDFSRKLYRMKKDGTGKEEIKLTTELPNYVASIPSIILTKQYILIFHEDQYGYFQVKYDGSEERFIH